MAHAVATGPPPDADEDQGCTTRALADQAASGSEDTIMGNSPTRNVDVFFRKIESAEAERPVRNESPVRKGLTQQNGSVSEDLFAENNLNSASSTRNENGEARDAAAAAESDASVKDDVFIENDRSSGSTTSVQDGADETPENRASSESDAPAAEDCASPEKNGHAESDNLTGGRTENDVCRTQLAASNSASSESAASSDNGFTDSSGQQEKGVIATVPPPPPQQLTGTSETPPSTKQRQVASSGSKPYSRSSVDLALSPTAAKATVSEPTL